jgi:hypothetical protein
MQNIQNYLIGGVSAVTSVLNDVVTCRKNNSAFDLKKGHENLFYALTLLGYSSYELSMRRRFALRPHVNPAPHSPWVQQDIHSFLVERTSLKLYLIFQLLAFSHITD